MRCGRGGCALGAWGIALMLTGLLLLIVSLPSWLWVAVLGLILIVLGFVLWRLA